MTKNTFESPWWYKQVPRDFMSSPDVNLMTAEECGSFFFLLQWAWLGGDNCTLPNDPQRLAKLARVEKVSDLVLGKFEVDKEGRLYNARLLEEWKEAVKRSKDGKKAISARWGKDIQEKNGGNTTVSPSKNDSNTTNNNTKTHTNTNKKQVTRQAQVVISPASNEASTSATTEPPNPGPSESAVRVTAKLTELLRREHPLKPDTLKKWAALAERILAKHSEQDVLAVMQWALVDSDNMFWRGRVYSMKHFANFFSTIHQQYGIRGAGKSGAANPLAARASSLSTGHDFSAMAKGDL